MGENDQHPPSITTAIERVLTASQRVVIDRIDLMWLEAREDMSTAARGAGMLLGAMILLFYGWIVVVGWAVYMVWGSLTLGTALGLAAALHVIGGALLGWFGAHTLKRIRPMRPDDPEADRREQQALSGGMKGAT